jgi:serine/threonine protein phosphatase PrpC
VTKLRAGAATDTGLVRRNNQDQLLVTETIFAVADGMGGHAGGEVASLTAVDALRAAFDRAEKPATAAFLVEAVQSANYEVYERSQLGDDLRGMGTTLTAAALVVEDGEERIAIANVGDSRAYMLSRGELTQLTEDHSVPEELVRQGQLEPDEVATHPQRHILTRALGILPDVEVDLWQMLPYRGDRIMLCSDGLPREVSDDQIAAILRRLADPKEAAQELISRARASGGADNITVVVIEVVSDEGGAEAASEALAGQATSATAMLPVTTAIQTAGAAGESNDRSRTGTTELDPVTGRVPPNDGPRVSSSPPRRRKRRITFRVVVFFFLLALIGTAGATAIVYFARGTFYVGLAPGAAGGTGITRPAKPATIVIYRGRPGGLLWFKPTIERNPQVTTDQIPAVRLPDIRQGKIEPSLTDAQDYLNRLVSEQTAVQPPATTTPTTATIPPLPPVTQ